MNPLLEDSHEMSNLVFSEKKKKKKKKLELFCCSDDWRFRG